MSAHEKSPRAEARGLPLPATPMRAVSVGRGALAAGRFRCVLPGESLLGVVAVGATVDIANDVQVVVVDVDYFNFFDVFQRMRHWPSFADRLREVNRAFVMSVVELSRSNQRIYSRRINVVSDQIFDDPNVVSFLTRTPIPSSRWSRGRNWLAFQACIPVATQSPSFLSHWPI